MSDTMTGGSLRRFDGRVAIVTGGGTGIGRSTAARLADEGASVVIAGRTRAALESVAAEIAARGGTALAVPTDITNEDAVIELVRRTATTFGRIDVLHNNAALVAGDEFGHDGEVAGIERDGFDQAIRVNVLGAVFCCKHAIPRMLDAGRGAIVNTTSVAALRGNARLSVYSMSKAAVTSLTVSVATQYGKRGIRCNAVAPAGILTETYLSDVPDERRAAAEQDSLTPYLGTPDDVAAAVAFLASDDSRFVTGQTLVVDGGRLAHWR